MKHLVITFICLLPLAAVAQTHEDAWIAAHQECVQKLLKGESLDGCPDTGAMDAFQALFRAERAGDPTLLCRAYRHERLLPGDIWALPKIVFKSNVLSGKWMDRYGKGPDMSFMDAAVSEGRCAEYCGPMFLSLYRHGDGYMGEWMGTLLPAFFMDTKRRQRDFALFEPLLARMFEDVEVFAHLEDLPPLVARYEALPDSAFKRAMLPGLRQALENQQTRSGASKTEVQPEQ